MQEIIAERIAIKPVLSGTGGGGGHEGTWRLRRLVRYERGHIRNRQRSIPEDLAFVSRLHGRKVRDDEEASIKLIDRWAMNALIPGEKELAILMHWEGRLTRELRLDMLHLEHLKRQRRGDTKQPAPSGRLGPGEDTKGPLLSLAEPEPTAPALRPAAEPEPKTRTLSPLSRARERGRG
jgi:hypothetical protein